MKRFKNSAFVILLILLLTFPVSAAYAQVDPHKTEGPTRILFMLDGSGSMFGLWDNEHKIDIAKRILAKLVDSLQSVKNVQLALRVYGSHSPKNLHDCKDTRLEVPFGPNSGPLIIQKLKEVRPKGTTPIAYSLGQAANDFPDAKGKNIIILITDGIEECNGNPCAVSAALQKKGIILRPFIIGINLDKDIMDAFNCVGKFYNAEDKESFKTILSVVISHALNNTTAQVNLLDINGHATETNVNMTFYDQNTGKVMYNLYHTMNDAGVPDTLYLDPDITYSLQVNTIPPVYKNNINLLPGKHNIIAVNAPQGDLDLKVPGITNYEKLQCIIRKAGSNDIVNVQEFNTKEKLIVGEYDLEILTLPRIHLKNVEIKQSYTTNIEIPQPGKLLININKDMFGSIYIRRGARLEWLYNIDETAPRQVVALQPGKYLIVYRSKRATASFLTKQNEFRITSGGATTVNLN